MLKLRFAGSGERAPDPPAQDATGVHVWRNHRGGIVACGFAHGGVRWMYWPYLASFRFDLQDGFITAITTPSAPLDVVWDTYRRSVLPMALHVAGFEALHASAIVSNGNVVAFCAVSETGKSTIAYGLHRRGLPQWSDDAVALRTDSGVEATPLPFEIRLRDESRTFFGVAIPDPRRFEDNGPGSQLYSETAPIGAICLLARSPANEARYAAVRRMPPAEAFPLLLEHAHVFDPFDGVRRERMLRAYLDLVGAVPVYEVAFVPGRDRLDGVLDTIIETLGLTLPAAARARRAS